MKSHILLLATAILILTNAPNSEAAFVQYRDENGKIHHVNTDYAKVPERYRSQVEDQLKAIEEKNKPIAVPAPNPPQNKTTQKQTKPIEIDTTPAIPITDSNRLKRFRTAMTDIQTYGFFPASFDATSELVSYMDKYGKKNTVTPATLSTVPPEFLPQIDRQIISLEKLAKQAKGNKSFNNSTPVEVFTKPNCSDCVRLITLLQVHKIPYLIYDVENSPTGKDFYKTMAGAPLPITRIKGKTINGVEVGAIKNALKEQ